MNFHYGQKEIDYLAGRDKRLGEAIEKIGLLRRPIDPDLFGSVVFNILGQQVSSAAQTAVWERICERFGTVTAKSLAQIAPEELRTCGLSLRKGEYIAEFTEKVNSGVIIPDRWPDMPDEAVIEELTSLRGIGRWTAEMLLIFSLERPDILSFGDFGIQKGLRMLYRHRTITKAMFERFRRRYSPYGTVAAFYLWEIAGGALGLTDPAVKKRTA